MKYGIRPANCLRVLEFNQVKESDTLYVSTTGHISQPLRALSWCCVVKPIWRRLTLSQPALCKKRLCWSSMRARWSPSGTNPDPGEGHSPWQTIYWSLRHLILRGRSTWNKTALVGKAPEYPIPETENGGWLEQAAWVHMYVSMSSYVKASFRFLLLQSYHSSSYPNSRFCSCSITVENLLFFLRLLSLL